MTMYGRYGWGLNPWRELRAFDNLMDSVLEGTGRRGHGGRFPALNIQTVGDDAVVTAEIPGVKAEEIDISVKGKVVTIRGERKSAETGEGETCHRRERWTGTFSRTVELPYGIDPAKVEATYKKGVLTVRLPRAESEKPRKIAVSMN
jgi:HSP20 family protein